MPSKERCAKEHTWARGGGGEVGLGGLMIKRLNISEFSSIVMWQKGGGS